MTVFYLQLSKVKVFKKGNLHITNTDAAENVTETPRNILALSAEVCRMGYKATIQKVKPLVLRDQGRRNLHSVPHLGVEEMQTCV